MSLAEELVLPKGTARDAFLELADSVVEEKLGGVISPLDGTAWDVVPDGKIPYIPIPRAAEVIIVARYTHMQRDIGRIAQAFYNFPKENRRLVISASDEVEVYEDFWYLRILDRARQVIESTEIIGVQAFPVLERAAHNWNFNKAKDKRGHAASGYFS